MSSVELKEFILSILEKAKTLGAHYVKLDINGNVIEVQFTSPRPEEYLS